MPENVSGRTSRPSLLFPDPRRCVSLLPDQNSPVWQIPEHLMNDILELILFLTRFNPSTLSKVELYPLMTMVSKWYPVLFRNTPSNFLLWRLPALLFSWPVIETLTR